MLTKSDTNITAILAKFNEHNIDVALLVPTKTGMEKSIMDATTDLREFFLEKQFHDYEIQEKGPDSNSIKFQRGVQSKVQVNMDNGLQDKV